MLFDEDWLVVPLPGGDRILTDRLERAAKDMSGAVLVTTRGYALLAGSAEFVRATVPEGVDQARARFAHYAKKLARPELIAIAQEYPPRYHSWATADEVPPETAVGEQLRLIAALVRGELPAPEFQTRWLAARRRSLDEGERVRPPLSDQLSAVFFALEDYTADPELRDLGELSDGELVELVRGQPIGQVGREGASDQ